MAWLSRPRPGETLWDGWRPHRARKGGERAGGAVGEDVGRLGVHDGGPERNWDGRRNTAPRARAGYEAEGEACPLHGKHTPPPILCRVPPACFRSLACRRFPSCLATVPGPGAPRPPPSLTTGHHHTHLHYNSHPGSKCPCPPLPRCSRPSCSSSWCSKHRLFFWRPCRERPWCRRRPREVRKPPRGMGRGAGGRENDSTCSHTHTSPPPPPTHTPHLIDSTRAHWSGGQHARGAPEALGGRGRYAQTHAPIDAPNSTHASNPGTHQWLANHLHPVKPTPKGATWPTQAGTTCKKKQPTNPPPPPPQKKKRAR